MATPKFATLVEAHGVNESTRLLTLEMQGEPLGFVGGQYVIVDTGLVGAADKPVKRAYSIISADMSQSRFSLCVLRHGEGMGSNAMHDLTPGDTLKFSGPWGKLRPDPGANDVHGPTLVLATDTGVTAALGLVQGDAYGPFVGATVMLWLRPSSQPFLPEAEVHHRLPGRLRNVRIEALPPVGHVERVPYVTHVVGELRRRLGLTWAYLAGDGAVNAAVAQDLTEHGLVAERCRTESFFNHARK